MRTGQKYRLPTGFWVRLGLQARRVLLAGRSPGRWCVAAAGRPPRPGHEVAAAADAAPALRCWLSRRGRSGVDMAGVRSLLLLLLVFHSSCLGFRSPLSVFKRWVRVLLLCKRAECCLGGVCMLLKTGITFGDLRVGGIDKAALLC